MQTITYTTTAVDIAGTPAAPARTYRAESAAAAAEAAARAIMTDTEWDTVTAGSATDVDGNETWFFVPAFGAPVQIVVRQGLANH